MHLNHLQPSNFLHFAVYMLDLLLGKLQSVRTHNKLPSQQDAGAAQSPELLFLQGFQRVLKTEGILIVSGE